MFSLNKGGAECGGDYITQAAPRLKLRLGRPNREKIIVNDTQKKTKAPYFQGLFIGLSQV
jgi:hypothetical protein